MTGAATAHRHQIYPKRYFDASPTWFAWNKLTVADVFALREEPGFEGQNIYFWLNHPIRFVRIVGFVVQIDLVGNGRYTLLTIDDSSGANIEVKIEKRPQTIGDDAVYPSNTLVDNVNVLVELSLPVVHVDQKPIELGHIVKAQGNITSWRQERQLELKRIFTVKDTNEEALHWSKVAEWKRTILNKPWNLTCEQRDAIDVQIQKDERIERKRAKYKKERQARHDQKRKQKDLEMERKRQDQEIEMNAGALKGSDVLPAPWE